jgi:hypothetical protein
MLNHVALREKRGRDADVASTAARAAAPSACSAMNALTTGECEDEEGPAAHAVSVRRHDMLAPASAPAIVRGKAERRAAMPAVLLETASEMCLDRGAR